MKTTESLLSWRRVATLAASTLYCVFALPAQATVAGPLITVTADGTVYEVPWREVSKGAASASGVMAYEVQDYSIETPEYAFTIGRALLDPDPSISYGVAVVDFGAPTTFLFTFTTPIVPTGSPNVVSASLTGSLTDGGRDGVTITPVGPKIQTSAVGSPLTAMGVDVSLGEVAGPLAGPAGTWNLLQVSAGFTLSGGNDGATLNGFASINEGQVPVPEPASLALLGLALAAAAAAGRGRRQG